jgi:hypothetical protein
MLQLYDCRKLLTILHIFKYTNRIYYNILLYIYDNNAIAIVEECHQCFPRISDKMLSKIFNILHDTLMFHLNKNNKIEK